MTDSAVPNLPSRDFDATAAFYSGFGFGPSYRDEGWLILRRGALQLEFFPFADLVPEESSFMCSVRVDDVDELYRQIADSGVEEKTVGYPRLHPVRDQPWGRRAGFLIDIDGTQLSLIENGAIRAGASDEREACLHIWLEALGARDGTEQGPDVAARARAKFSRPIVRFAVAGAEPSAFALTVDTSVEPGTRVASLELLAVSPSDAGRGIGRALVADAIEAATQSGYSAIELSVRAGNDRAANLYTSCGFTPQGEPTPHPLGGPPMIGYALQLPGHMHRRDED